MNKLISVRFAWYDIWTGIYIDRKNKMVHVCPLPTLLVSIDLKEFRIMTIR
jgi:hypothetical protein